MLGWVETKFLTEVLEQRHCELVRELTHAGHREFKITLKNNERLLESILSKLRSVETVPS